MCDEADLRECVDSEAECELIQTDVRVTEADIIFCSRCKLKALSSSDFISLWTSINNDLLKYMNTIVTVHLVLHVLKRICHKTNFRVV